MDWIKYTKQKPKQGQIIDIWMKGRGRENDYEYKGDNVLYNNELGMLREFDERTMEATHWIPIPPEPSE